MRKLLVFWAIFNLWNYSLVAQDLIENLPQSIILVRLQTNEHIIQHHLQEGNYQLANEKKIKQKKKNNKIINTFLKEWAFCPVYFFNSNSSEEIINRNFQNVFKDINETKLNIEEKKRFKDDFIVIYFGQTQGKLKFDALVLNNSKIQQLKKPYPKFIRTYKGLGPLKRGIKKIIEILNQKISWYQDNK